VLRVVCLKNFDEEKNPAGFLYSSILRSPVPTTLLISYHISVIFVSIHGVKDPNQTVLFSFFMFKCQTGDGLSEAELTKL